MNLWQRAAAYDKRHPLGGTSPTPGMPMVFPMGGPGIAASLIAPIPAFWALFDRCGAVSIAPSP